jgi:DNA-binding PadR family transcriptional regulator
VARPQKLSDEEIVTVIMALRASHRPATGVDIRRELHQRFGVRCGTDRIYQLLRGLGSQGYGSPPGTPEIAQLVVERDAALRRAELAEYREEATQARTASEIDSLRQRLRALGVDPFAPPGSGAFPV